MESFSKFIEYSISKNTLGTRPILSTRRNNLNSQEIDYQAYADELNDVEPPQSEWEFNIETALNNDLPAAMRLKAAHWINQRCGDPKININDLDKFCHNLKKSFGL